MTVKEKEMELSKEIKRLEKSRDERKRFLLNNIDAPNYDEIARDKRAIEVKIETKKRHLDGIGSKKGESHVQTNITLPFSHAY